MSRGSDHLREIYTILTYDAHLESSDLYKHLEIIEEELERLDTYDEILSGDRLTIYNKEEEAHELKVLVGDYSQGQIGVMIYDIADKLGKLEDAYDKTKEE